MDGEPIKPNACDQRIEMTTAPTNFTLPVASEPTDSKSPWPAFWVPGQEPNYLQHWLPGLLGHATLQRVDFNALYLLCTRRAVFMGLLCLPVDTKPQVIKSHP